MRKRAAKASGTNPNFLPVSPKRGLAGDAVPSADQRPRAVLPLKNVPTAGSNTPSSSHSRPGRQTRSTKPATFASLPNAEDIREKRQWTVARTLNESDDGSTITVEWKDTVVPSQSIRHDEEGRAFVWADRIRHYIAQRSRSGWGSGGQALWKCKWEPSEIPKKLLLDLEVEASESASETELDAGLMLTPSRSASPVQTSSPLQPHSPDQITARLKALTEAKRRQRRPRRGSTASMMSFSELPKAWPKKLRFRVESEDLDYGPGVHRLIKSKLGTEISTTLDLPPPSIARRIGKPSNRPLMFRGWTVKKNRTHRINLKVHRKAKAVLVHMQGDAVVEPCDFCADGHGVMQGCVVSDDFGAGECMNCHYQGRSTYCNFRKNMGGRPAKVVKYRPPKKVATTAKASLPATQIRAKPPEPATTEPPKRTDANDGLRFSERDFVFSTGESPSAISGRTPAGERFIMSGGLGEMTATPVPNPKQARARSRSRTPNDSDDVPLTKRKKIETIDLTSSPETGKLPKPKLRHSSPAADRRSRKKGCKGKHKASQTASCQRCSANFTPPISPPSSPPPMPKKMQSGTLASRLKEPAIVSPEIATSGPTKSTTSTARLQQRRQQSRPAVPQASSSRRQDASMGQLSSAPVQPQCTSDTVYKKQNKSDRQGATPGGIKSQTGRGSCNENAQPTVKAGAQLRDSNPRLPALGTANPVPGLKPAKVLHAKHDAPRSRSPPVVLPNPTEQTTVYKDQRFERAGDLSSWRFSFIWHRCNAETKDLLSRLLRWAWHENRVPRTTTLAEFYSQRDDERGWLNDVVIPKFCPPRPKKASVIELDASSGESESESEDEIVLPPGSFDGDWIGSSGSSDSSGESEDSGDGSSGSEESAETGASEESDSSDSDDD